MLSEVSDATRKPSKSLNPSLSASEAPRSLTLGRVSRLLFFGAILLILVVDQLTKAWVVARLPLYEPTDLWQWLSSILSFTYVKNTGVAFGLFQGLGRAFALLPVLVVVAVVVVRRSMPVGDLWVHLSLGLVVGGALGNVIDRLLRGYVVDFLDVNFRPLQSWPVFNAADAAVVVGVAILLLDTFLADTEEAPADA